jgi:hypothetical protein
LVGEKDVALRVAGGSFGENEITGQLLENDIRSDDIAFRSEQAGAVKREGKCDEDSRTGKSFHAGVWLRGVHFFKEKRKTGNWFSMAREANWLVAMEGKR